MGCYAHGYSKRIDFDMNSLPNFHKDVYDKLNSSTDEEDTWIAYDYLHMKVTKYVTNNECDHIVSPSLRYTTVRTKETPYISFRLRNWPTFELRSFEDIKYIKEYILEGKDAVYYLSDGSYVQLTSNFESKEWKAFEEYLKSLWEEFPDLVIDFA